MRICKSCGEKFNLNQNLKSIFTRDGRIECEKCNSIFVLKKEKTKRCSMEKYTRR